MPSRKSPGTRPPASVRRISRGRSSSSRKTSEPAPRCSGQSVKSSTRTPPASPLAPRMRATASRSALVGDDLQLHVAAVARGHHAQQAADGVRDPPVAPDHPPHVALVDAERQRHLVVLLLDLDPDRVRVVDKGSRQVLEELLHASFVSSASAASVAASASAPSVASASGGASGDAGSASDSAPVSAAASATGSASSAVAASV